MAVIGVGWPPEGTLDMLTIWRVWQAVTEKAGHPDQFLYIDSWLEVTQTPPPCVQFPKNRQGQSKGPCSHHSESEENT
jgi:hypothetical protein